VSTGWLSEDRADIAVRHILDGAEAEFADHGVATTTMAAIARRAGCSRATVYAYFSNRHELRLAVVNRAAIRIADQVATATADLTDPDQRLVEAVLGSVEAVRATPSLAYWFSPVEMAHVHELSDSSEVIDAIVSGFTGTLTGPEEDQALRARWILRVIVSLLTMPGRDDAEERALVERFVAPSVAPTAMA
jgi:AcrR family transcriptional regulator